MEACFSSLESAKVFSTVACKWHRNCAAFIRFSRLLCVVGMSEGSTTDTTERERTIYIENFRATKEEEEGQD